MLLKSFRLFVSSTFKDFSQERELLQNTVFPALNAYCAARGYQFHAVDLRWGVNEEAQLDQRTAEICLGEVIAAKGYPAPNFLIMVGDRYGWVPLPFAIAQDEFEAALAWLESRGEHDAVRDLRHVYQLDENHVLSCGFVAAFGAPNTTGPVAAPDTSAYTLRSREDEVAELKDAAIWEKLEARLRAALQAAADRLLQLGRIDAAGHEKYFLSLTEQEIIHGLPGYRRIGTPSGTAVPKQADAVGPHAIAWIRERAVPRRTGLLRRWLEPSSVRPAPDPRVAALKSDTLHALPEDSVVIATASAGVDGTFDQAYLDMFVSTIGRKLEAAIDSRISAVESEQNGQDAEHRIERAEHGAFVKNRCKVFFGQDINCATIAKYVAGSSTHPLVLYGRSGSGKSALMARAVADAEAAGGVPVIYRFVGASAASSDQRAMLTSLVDELAANGIAVKPSQWEDDFNKFVAQVRELLSTIDTPVVIFVDALDQLRKPYRPGWLPDQLLSALKIVVSVLDDGAFPVDSGVYKGLRQRLPADAFLEIEPLRPTHGHDILAALEQTARRRLQPGQRDYIVGQFMKAGASPLYLLVAFEIARGWRSTDKAGSGGRELAEDTTALIAQFIDKLSTLHHHERLLVSRTLGYLAAAKDGLSASELTAILSRDADLMQAISSEQHGARTSKLPISVWVRLLRHLEALLVEKRIDGQPLLQFFHRQLAEVARERFYAGTQAALHVALATYFDAPVNGTDDATATSGGSGTVYSRRSLSELLYHLHYTGQGERLNELLLSPVWMQQKLSAFNSPHPLIEDYRVYAEPQQSDETPLLDKTVRLVGQALELSAGALARDFDSELAKVGSPSKTARQLIPQILGRLPEELGRSEGELAQVRKLISSSRELVLPPGLLPRWPRLTSPGGAELRRFDGHNGAVNAVAFAPDGRTIASGSSDATLGLWDAKSGIRLHSFRGHTGAIKAIAFSPDGRRIVSISNTNSDTGEIGEIKLWDVLTGLELPGGSKATFDDVVTFSIDGYRIISASSSNRKMLWLWDADALRRIGIYWTDQNILARASIAFTPDGRTFVSVTNDNILRLWDTETGTIKIGRNGMETRRLSPSTELCRLSGPHGSIAAIAISPDRHYVVSVSRGELGRLNNNTLQLFDGTTGAALETFRGHSGSVNAVAFSPDGCTIVSGSDDLTLRIWDAKLAFDGNGATGIKHPSPDGYSRPVTVVKFSPDGRTLVSGSEVGAQRLWDSVSGVELRRLNVDSKIFLAIAYSIDGHIIFCGPAGRVGGPDDKVVRLWDAGSTFGTDSSRGVELLRLQGHSESVIAVAFTPDWRLLVSGSHDRTVRLWDAVTGDEIRVFRGHGGWVNAVAISPDGRTVASSGNYDWTLIMWDAASGNILNSFYEKEYYVTAIAFSADGSIVVSGSMSPRGSSVNNLRWWDVVTGAELRGLSDYAFSVIAVAFAPQGHYLVSSGDDKTLRLWDADRTSPSFGGELARLEGDVVFTCIDLSLDGKRLTAGDALGRVHLFDILLNEGAKTAWLAEFKAAR